MKHYNVVAAVVCHKGKYLCMQKGKTKFEYTSYKWEFPGGKVEPGETKEQALARECREELAVTLSVGEVFMEVIHEYPDLTVRLTLFHATIADGVPQKLEHNDIHWIGVDEIPNYDFCPADKEVLRRLQNEY